MTLILRKLNKFSPYFKKVTKKDSSPTVKEIHDAFYSEEEKLFQAAQAEHKTDEIKTDLLEKNKRLKDLGFKFTREMKDSQVIQQKISDLENTKKESKLLVEAIEYFRMKYPLYKLITLESVKRLCHQYHLLYGEVGFYTGEVPDKNLKEIEDFKIAPEDEGYFVQSMGSPRFLSKDKYEDLIKKNGSRQLYRKHGKAPFDIVAPYTDFDLRNMDVENFHVRKSEVTNDPIVLKSVIFKETRFFLIVTAWGKEASDADVVNERHN